MVRRKVGIGGAARRANPLSCVVDNHLIGLVTITNAASKGLPIDATSTAWLDVAPATWLAACEQIGLLKSIATERIRDEFIKTLIKVMALYYTYL